MIFSRTKIRTKIIISTKKVNTIKGTQTKSTLRSLTQDTPAKETLRSIKNWVTTQKISKISKEVHTTNKMRSFRTKDNKETISIHSSTTTLKVAPKSISRKLFNSQIFSLESLILKTRKKALKFSSNQTSIRIKIRTKIKGKIHISSQREVVKTLKITAGKKIMLILKAKKTKFLKVDLLGGKRLIFLRVIKNLFKTKITI